MILSESTLVRLYGTSNSLNENGYYQLEPFDTDGFNEEFDIDDIDEVLGNLCDYMYYKGSWHQIDDNLIDGDGQVCIPYGDNDEIKIADIRGIINCSDDARFYVIVSDPPSEFDWFVTEPARVISSD